jgi:glycosyltransferase involved in cell wall biosynthesis
MSQYSSRPDHRITRSPDHPILYVSYPLLTVSENSAGGAEQMLWTLEHEMVRRGVNTTVAASAGSQVSGELFVTGEPCSLPDDFERRNREHQQKIVELVHKRERQHQPFDLIHDKSGSFWPQASGLDVPVLATLHLPRHFYSPQLFENTLENVCFNCVSQSQALSFADLNPEVVPNGILLDRFQPNFGSRHGLLWLGRICEEKAPHLALEIAARANQPIILAGHVYPFSYHQRYFEREILPRLAQMPRALFTASPSFEQKCQLLGQAKAVLITSLVEETSSLVAMEAAASGTPVVAFRRGALPEIVKDGVTGFLVDGVEEAADAVVQIRQITLADCVRHAQNNFSSGKMAAGYERLYDSVIMDKRRAA